MTPKSDHVGSDAGNGVPESGTPSEAKRLAARRRFLLGGAAAVPLIVTLGQREAWAASTAVCRSLGMRFDWKYYKRNLKKKGENQSADGKLSYGHRRGWDVSAYCDPTQRWS